MEIPQGAHWSNVMEAALRMFIEQTPNVSAAMREHLANTPDRVIRAFEEYVSGYEQDPAEPLRVTFGATSLARYSEMVHCRNVQIVSMCAHHFAPIIGVAHFAYIPKGRVVGLSKIPRFIRILARRFQVQENLTEEIVDWFQQTVTPKGCAVSIWAKHCCMSTRGVMEPNAVTQTTALRGIFSSKIDARSEFLSSLAQEPKIL